MLERLGRKFVYERRRDLYVRLDGLDHAPKIVCAD
jgi:hypothetical protein